MEMIDCEWFWEFGAFLFFIFLKIFGISEFQT